MTRRGDALPIVVAGVVAVGAAAALWLTRDPEPHFARRRGALLAAHTVDVRADTGSVTTVHRLTGSSGLAVTIAVRRPRDAPAGPRPVFVILGGYRAGAAAADALPSLKGHTVVGVEYPFTGDLGVRGAAVLGQVPAIRAAMLDTPPAVSLALDWLLLRPDVDSTAVELVGASFGAPFATIAAARDARVSRLWLLHGAGKPYTLMRDGLRGTPWGMRHAAAGLGYLLANGPRMRPERWIGRVAPRPVVMINAADDERIARDAVDVLYAAAGDPKRILWLPGPHMTRSRTAVLRALVDTVVALSGH